MNRAPPPSSYTLKRARQLLGLSRAMLSGLISAGIVAPTRGPRNERRFSFQDLMLLRTAHGLQQAGIRPRKILEALSSLKEQLPTEIPLTGLRISAVGSKVAVKERFGHLEAQTGQWLMDFDAVPVGDGSVAVIPAAKTAPSQAAPGMDWFDRGEAYEAERNAGQAEFAYRQAVLQNPADIRCYLNLGALLCDAGRSPEAALLFDQALLRVGPHPLLHFNHGVAHEGNADSAAALSSYREALALDSSLADAHYNLAVLLQRQGDSQGALRHFSAYRRLGGTGSG